MNTTFCKKCGINPVVHGTSAWNDVLCTNCTAEFDERVLDLSIKRSFGLPDWPFICECRQIGWHFHIAPEIVSDYVIEISTSEITSDDIDGVEE